jgi:hypothetical protein
MRLVMTLLARDVADVVADTLDFHLASGVDHVIATDNDSVDGTREILEGYRDRGALTLLHASGRDHRRRQSEWVTRMARLAAVDHGANWVINADSDEFFTADEAVDLRDVLAAVPERYGLLVVPTSNFRARRGESGPWHRRLTVRETFSLKPGGGRLIVRLVHRATPDVVVADGNHSAAGAGLAPMPGWRPIECLHAPFRTRAQYVHKIVAGGTAFKPWLSPEQLTSAGANAAYDAQLVDDGTVEAGIRAGALVLDTRVARALDAIRAGEPAPPPGPPTGGGALAWPELPVDVAERRARALQAAYERKHGPEHDAVHQLRGGLALLPAHLRRRAREVLQRR